MSLSQATTTAGGGDRLWNVIQRLSFRPGWTFGLKALGGFPAARQLVVGARVPDSHDPSRVILVDHSFLVPPWADWSADDEIVRWIFFCIADVDRHEAREFLCLDGEQVDPPQHGEGANPYGRGRL